MDIVGYMDVEKVADGSERRLWTQPNITYYAKDRSDKLPNPIVNPNFTEILKMIFGDEPTKAEAETKDDQSPKEPAEELTPVQKAKNKAQGLNADGSQPENSVSDSATPAQTDNETTS